ncbi:uncharacterized protein [Physcomitrium patens]|uniref:uncharacterized protein isoform X1 n=1 Tax=Physcomitrium patens TaxID=3218 RepID=UPI000D16CF43|nr:uncharacterized protein LOC112279560 isoform X1 [Physcomitrium patens]XP_024369898.1 uncharacterized protein LOC112279560 isoform X1 [Physcomitrium patens]XP_024369899.1 uncharacterized protein LOC112279560 isoform X1 [Physcomitrium patens]XP_024369900.1 uncharacterized protein LOC112279560 isoform X1 [Physcomitrium patens]|eukprot:XP_024369897.1 uncharacterized protein LOC112279560 isoform X1 [Physcomitrella patens]
MVFRIVSRVRELFRVMRDLPSDDSIRRRTLAINAQLAKVLLLQEARLAQEKFREEAALQEVHAIVSQMTQLKESLTAAEQAAVEFVDQLGDQATVQLEDEWNKKAETLMTTVAKTQERLGADLPQLSNDSVLDSKNKTK